MANKVSQKTDILNHLKRFRTLTVLQAFALYGVTSLSSRLNELRKEGHCIGGISIRVKTRRGHATVVQHYLTKRKEVRL